MQEFSVISFEFWGLRFYAFGILLGVAGILSLLLLSRDEKRRGLKPGSAPAMLLAAGLLGLFCSRLVFSIIQREKLFFDVFDGHFLGLQPFFALQHGGFSLFGFLFGLLLAGFLFAKASRQRLGTIYDWLALPSAVFLSLLSLGQFLGGQGYGEQLEAEALQFFPIAVQNSFGEWYLAVFLYQGLLLAGIALFLRFSRARGSLGDRMIRLLGLFCSLQIFLESLRQDAYLRMESNAFIRLNQVMALLVLLALLLMLSRRALKRGRPGLLWAPWLSLLIASGCAIAAEFNEKLPLPKPVLYLASLLALSLHAWLALSAFQAVAEPLHGAVDLRA